MNKLNFLDRKDFENADDVSVGSHEDKDEGVFFTRDGGSFRNFVMT